MLLRGGSACGYLSEVRVDIGDHVKAGQVLAVIDVPEMKHELAEAKAQLEARKSSLESARRQLDHNRADVALQNALAKDREQLGEGRQFISDRTLDQVHANVEIAKADFGVAEANRTSRPTKSTSPRRPWRRSRRCSPTRRSWRLSMAWWRGVR
jgi:multidrug resistance efflux pump